MLKAIETEYNGYRFRSRLEARWAVFFDAMGVKYEYEKEGYDLDGLWYLPDFWLPEQECWVEIKGQKPTREEHAKCIKLMQHANPRGRNPWGMIKAYDKNVYLFAGDIPSPDAIDYKSCLCAYSYGTEGLAREYGWTECLFCGLVGITLGCSIQDLPCRCAKKHIRMEAIDEILVEIRCKTSDRFVNEVYGPKRQVFLAYHDTPRLVEAYTAARSARFEHKEAHNKLRQKVNTNLEQISLLQAKATKPDIPTLTTEEVKEHWDYVKKRCRTEKDGVKISVILNGYTVVGVEGTKELPVIVLQAKANFFYSAIASDMAKVATVDWAMKTELKQECMVRLMKPTMEPLPNWDKESCDICRENIGTIEQGGRTV
jgi:hypothetical protein